MAGAVNKVILVGHLGGEPEMRYTQGGTPVANFSIATNESWTNKDGQKQDKKEWHRIIVWSKLAEICVEYLSKGRQVYVEGKLQTRQWENRDGNKQYTTEIVAREVVFLGGAGTTPNSSVSQTNTNNTHEDPPAPVDDDLPF